jgi:hypothetical protein
MENNRHVTKKSATGNTQPQNAKHKQTSRAESMFVERKIGHS